MTTTKSGNDGPKLMLVSMPWSMPDMTCVAVGTLKAYASAQGFPVQSRFYSKDVSSYIGSHAVERIIEEGFGERVFGALLFPDHFKPLADRLAARFGPLKTTSLIEQMRRFVDDICNDLCSQQINVLGFTTTHNQILASVLIAAEMKKRRPEIAVVFGGLPLHGQLAENLLHCFPCVDFIIVGEGEKALVRLLEALAGDRPVSSVPQLMRRTSDGIAFSDAVEKLTTLDDELPSPDYDDHFAHHLPGTHGMPFPRLQVQSSRGCKWGKCSFCIEGLPSRSGYRTKSPDNMVREIRELTERYKSTEVHFADADIATRDDLFQLLAESSMNVAFGAEVTGMVKKATLIKMKKAGARTIQIGVESFSGRMLKKFIKGVPLIRYVERIKWCEELGIHLVYNVIVGAPFETQADIDVAVRNMRLLHWFQPPSISRFIVAIGSRILQFPEEYEIDQIIPLKEVDQFPLDVVDKIGALLTLGGGHGFVPSKSNLDGERVIRDSIDQWNREYARRPKLTGRTGNGFLTLEISMDGEPSQFMLVDDPAECEVYLHCAPHSLSLKELQTRLPHLSEERVLAATDRFHRAGLMFIEDYRFLSLASFDARVYSQYSDADGSIVDSQEIAV